LKNDKTIVAYHFGQYYGLLQKEWRIPDACSITIVLINGCFHNGPVISPRLVIMAQGRLYWPKAMLRANTTFRGPLCLNRGHIAGPLWKTPISYTDKYNIIIYCTHHCTLTYLLNSRNNNKTFFFKILIRDVHLWHVTMHYLFCIVQLEILFFLYLTSQNVVQLL
jgi:hypothetical protein